LQIEPEVFAKHLVRHVGVDGPKIDCMETARLAELLLTLGCGLGDRAALERFDSDYFRSVPTFVRRVRLGQPELDELLQTLREQLLVARNDGGAKILDFSGRGPLGGWLRVASLRLALKLRNRRLAERARGDEAIADASVTPDPELYLARLGADQAFKAAFEKSLAAISDEERTVLRMHFVDGSNLDEIALAYGIHRATAARWLASGRKTIAKLTRKHLRESLRLESRDLDSVLRLVGSHLELSLSRVLWAASSGEEE
jgi:RNA polymerase sigma-70 factor (ECF subfamily)